MEVYDAVGKLPEPDDINDVDNTYYVIKVEGFTNPMLAMYMKDDSGNCDWYTSYATKLIKPVEYWCDFEGYVKNLEK